MDAVAGADGFGGGDVDGGRWRGHPLRWLRGHPLRWAIGNYLRELLDDLFMFQFFVLIEF